MERAALMNISDSEKERISVERVQNSSLSLPLTVQVRVISLSLALQKDSLFSLTNSHLKPDVHLDKNQQLLHLGVRK